MKLKVTVSITVGRSTLDYYSKCFIKRAIKAVIKNRLAKLPPTYTIEKIKVEEVTK